MLTKWAPFTTFRRIALLAAALFAVMLAAPAIANAQQPNAVTSDVQLKLERNGLVTVTEKITVPPGAPVERGIPLRQSTGPGIDRVFAVDNAVLDGPGQVNVTADEVRMTLNPGASTLHYTVHGAVADAGGLQDVRWQVSGGWSAPVESVEVSMLSPRVPQEILCLAGPVGTGARCPQYEITHTQSMHATTQNLQPGERMDITFKLPAGTVPATAVTEEYFSLAHAFSLTPATGAGLIGIGFLVIAGIGLVWYARGRDARAFEDNTGPVAVLMTEDDGSVAFASPDGVLPGQIGTVIDETVDPVDVTATIVDLAVRNYLWIEELSGDDWRFVAINPPDENLRPFERAVYELVVSQAAENTGVVRAPEILLSRFGKLDLSKVRDTLYAEVVDKEWFARRPDSDRNLFWWIGIGVILGGVALTVALALTSTAALLGLGVILGGVAMMFSARLMPARTRRGSALVVQVRGLRGYLHEIGADTLPPADREMVFSRALPYAVVLEETDRWLTEFAELDPAADGTPGLYWYGTAEVSPDLREFRTKFPAFVTRLNTILKG